MKEIGVIGLGKMGFNLIQNIKNNGYQPVGFDVNQQIVNQVKEIGIETANSVEELVKRLPKPRYILLSIPAGKITAQQVQQLLTLLDPKDVILDAGNSFYQDTIKRAQLAAQKGIEFVDVGTSGGVSGALNGACLMVGGKDEVIHELTPLFTKLAVKDGFLHTGKVGSGHYAKMIHNGIEYGMMQAIAEGFEIIENSNFNFDQAKLAKV
jgi:6-phosphogluconate dehydrogenase